MEAAGDRASAAPAFTPKTAEGYLFGLLAAGLWGAGPVLMRAGLDTTQLGIWGGTVAYATAAVVLLFALAIPGQATGVVKMDRDAQVWFSVSAVNSFLANVFRFSALALAPVSVVIPLMRTAVVFQLGFNYLINRSIESFEPKVLGGFVRVAGRRDATGGVGLRAVGGGAQPLVERYERRVQEAGRRKGTMRRRR